MAWKSYCDSVHVNSNRRMNFSCGEEFDTFCILYSFNWNPSAKNCIRTLSIKTHLRLICLRLDYPLTICDVWLKLISNSEVGLGKRFQMSCIVLESTSIKAGIIDRNRGTQTEEHGNMYDLLLADGAAASAAETKSDCKQKGSLFSTITPQGILLLFLGNCPFECQHLLLYRNFWPASPFLEILRAPLRCETIRNMILEMLIKR